MKVVHCKKEPYDVYCGRPSKWDNPFVVFGHEYSSVGIDKFSREEAIEKYREWITLGGGKHLLNDLHELKGKTLGCWCKPKACHCDILLELANKVI